MKQGDSMNSENEATKIFFKSSEGVCSLLDGQGNRAYLKAGHALLAEVKSEGSTPIEICMTDRLGSVLGMHASAASIPYMPYGFSGPNFLEKKTLGFNGELHDDAARCYLLGVGYHRPYSPTLMRFIRSDDASPFGAGGINAYAYCVGDPINNIDPSGHASSFGVSLSKGFKNRFAKRGERKANEYKVYVSSQRESLEKVKVYELEGTDFNKAQTGHDQYVRLKNDLKNIPDLEGPSKAGQRYMDKHGWDTATDDARSFATRRSWLEAKLIEMEAYFTEYNNYRIVAANERTSPHKFNLKLANEQVRRGTLIVRTTTPERYESNQQWAQ